MNKIVDRSERTFSISAAISWSSFDFLVSSIDEKSGVSNRSERQQNNRDDWIVQLNDELANTFYIGYDERLNGEITSDVRKLEWGNRGNRKKGTSYHSFWPGEVSPFCTVQGKGEQATCMQNKNEKSGTVRASHALRTTMRSRTRLTPATVRGFSLLLLGRNSTENGD